MLFGSVACDEIPDDSGYNTDGCAEPECGAPAVASDDLGEQRRSQSCPRADTGEDDAVDAATISDRDPLGYKLVGRGVHDGFADAERESDGDQGRKRI